MKSTVRLFLSDTGDVCLEKDIEGGGSLICGVGDEVPEQHEAVYLEKFDAEPEQSDEPVAEKFVDVEGIGQFAKFPDGWQLVSAEGNTVLSKVTKVDLQGIASALELEAEGLNKADLLIAVTDKLDAEPEQAEPEQSE